MIKLDWKSLLSITAVITSCCALYVSSRQLKIASEEQQASVFPYMTAAYNSSEERIELYLSNDGLGPAFISGVEVRLGDSTYTSFWEPVADFLKIGKYEFNSPTGIWFTKSDLLPGWVIRANSNKYTLFVLDHLKPGQARQFWQYYNDKEKGIQAKIWYLDLYNHCWLFDYNASTVTRCDKCPNEVLKR